MKKDELMNGDIVVLRSGYLAVVIRTGDYCYLLFQKSGYEDLDPYYDDDMVNEFDDDAIMQVFRGGMGFDGVDEETPIYERDENWVRPSEEELRRREELARIRRNEQLQAERIGHKESVDNGLISIITQAFYGNRTGTAIRPENIDRFVLGCLSDDIPVFYPIDRTIVRLPGSDALVLVYNKHKEAERLEEKARAWEEEQYEMKPLAAIPELNLEIYSRCIVCRMNENGLLESVRDKDFEIWGRYLAD